MGGTHHLLSQDLWGGSTGSYMGDGTVHVPPATGYRHIRGPECLPSGWQGTSHRGEDARKKMHRLRGVEGAGMGGCLGGQGSGQVPQGFREGEFQAKERAPANTNIFVYHILSLMQKKKGKKISNST